MSNYGAKSTVQSLAYLQEVYVMQWRNASNLKRLSYNISAIFVECPRFAHGASLRPGLQSQSICYIYALLARVDDVYHLIPGISRRLVRGNK